MQKGYFKFLGRSSFKSAVGAPCEKPFKNGGYIIFNILEIDSRVKKTIQNSPGSSAGFRCTRQNCGRIATVAVGATHVCSGKAEGPPQVVVVVIIILLIIII